MGGAGVHEVVLRRATPADATAVADVWLRSYTAALPGVRRAHSDQEVRRWFRDVVIPARETWVDDEERQPDVRYAWRPTP